jgi:hypothetical protein
MLNYQRVIKPRIDSQGWKWSGVDTTIKVVYYYTGTKVFWEFHFGSSGILSMQGRNYAWDRLLRKLQIVFLFKKTQVDWWSVSMFVTNEVSQYPHDHCFSTQSCWWCYDAINRGDRRATRNAWDTTAPICTRCFTPKKPLDESYRIVLTLLIPIRINSNSIQSIKIAFT